MDWLAKSMLAWQHFLGSMGLAILQDLNWHYKQVMESIRGLVWSIVKKFANPLVNFQKLRRFWWTECCGYWITNQGTSNIVPRNEWQPVNSSYTHVELFIACKNIASPKFDGDSKKWRQFYDFPVSNVQKMWYFKATLSGEAEKLMIHLPTTADNVRLEHFTRTELYLKQYWNRKKDLQSPTLSNISQKVRS